MIKLHKIILQRKGKLCKITDMILGNICKKDVISLFFNWILARSFLSFTDVMIGVRGELLPLFFLSEGNSVDLVTLFF